MPSKHGLSENRGWIITWRWSECMDRVKMMQYCKKQGGVTGERMCLHSAQRQVAEQTLVTQQSRNNLQNQKMWRRRSRANEEIFGKAICMELNNQQPNANLLKFKYSLALMICTACVCVCLLLSAGSTQKMIVIALLWLWSKQAGTVGTLKKVEAV